MIRSIWSAVFGKVTAAARAVGAVVTAVFRAVGVPLYAGSETLSAPGGRPRWALHAERPRPRGRRSALRVARHRLGDEIRGVGRVRSAWSSAMSAVRSACGESSGRAPSRVRPTTPGPVQAVARALSGALVNALRLIGRVGASAFNALLHPVRAVESVIHGVIGAVQSLIGALGRIHVPKISLPKIPGLSAASAPAVPGAVGSPRPPAGVSRVRVEQHLLRAPATRSS